MAVALTHRVLNGIKKTNPWFPVFPAFFIPPLYFFAFGFDLQWLLGTLVAFFIVDNLGVQIGVHKLLSHRAFQTTVFVRRMLAFFSVLSGQGSPLFWVAVHMGSHHPHSDSEKDAHSPSRGFKHSFILWYWNLDLKKLSFLPAREYLSDKFLLFLHKNHTLVLMSYWILLGLISFDALVYLGLLPAALSISMVGLVNTYMHSNDKLSKILFLKYQNYPNDNTYNSVWLGMLTMGLSLHNNHHHDPHKKYYADRWFEIDPSRWVIPLLEKKIASQR